MTRWAAAPWLGHADAPFEDHFGPRALKQIQVALVHRLNTAQASVP
jgi:hypothetical protein